MNLYLISHPLDKVEWDTYDSVVVCAPNEETAKRIDPLGKSELIEWNEERAYWCAPANVRCKLIGLADDSIQQGVICASYNS
jgi:hypothetical protein